MAQPGSGPVYLTVEEFESYELPEDMTAELVRGELVLSPGPGTRHGIIQLRLGARLLAFVTERRLGTVLTAGGFELLELAQTVRVPDIAFVSAERLPGNEIPATGFAKVPPDLAVEILSPSDPKSRIQSKLDDYRDARFPLVWLVDPKREVVRVIALDENPRLHGIDDVLDGGAVLRGFSMPVSQIFE